MDGLSLGDLTQDLAVIRREGAQEVLIKGIAHDSRLVKPGFLFVCIQGYKTDGHRYLAQAAAQGAIAALVDREIAGLELPDGISVVQVGDTRPALALVSARFYQFPAAKLLMIGVTGTNGKTTTTHLIEEILKDAGRRVGLIGTIHNKVGDEILPVRNTTPLPLELQGLLAKMVDKGADTAVMEVSSHALELGRVEGIEFDLAVFTNLTQDHLDFHGTMENYREAKAKLFADLRPDGGKVTPKYGIINTDDPAGGYLMEKCPVKAITYGIHSKAQVKASEVEVRAAGVSFSLDSPWGRERFHLKLTGLFSVYNALAAICVGLVQGIGLPQIKRVLENVAGVAGRFEPVSEGQDFGVIVDYAHTPDSLENILNTAREFVPGRIITVFGCGGDRDRTKRPIMGRIAARFSAYAVITSDNPRSEDPAAIIDEVETGVREIVGPDRYVKMVDRREAICHAINQAKTGDLVIIAGKGHETYQIIKDRSLPFDDREVARECLRKLLQHRSGTRADRGGQHG